MANQMVTFPSSMAFLELGQIFTVGSMTWIIGPDGNGEIVEVVQDHPVPIVPTSTTTSLISTPRRWVRRSISIDNLIASIDQVINRLAECQLLVDSILDQSRASDEVPALQGHHATNAEHPARARRLRWQDEDLVITATLEGHTVQCRPLPAPMESMLKPYCFVLVGADMICQDAYTIFSLTTPSAAMSMTYTRSTSLRPTSLRQR